jgi:hypothetical protein
VTRPRWAIDTRPPNDPDRMREEIEKATIGAVINTAREMAHRFEQLISEQKRSGRARSIKVRQQAVRRRRQLVANVLAGLPPGTRALPTHNPRLIAAVKQSLDGLRCRVPSDRTVASDIAACRKRGVRRTF